MHEFLALAVDLHDQRVDEGGEGSLGPAMPGGTTVRLAHTAQALRAY